ncbi:hypothetical protein Ancab_024258 [Ancistrocladus abbreviatus]
MCFQTFSVVSDAFDGAALADVFAAFLVDGAVAGDMVLLDLLNLFSAGKVAFAGASSAAVAVNLLLLMLQGLMMMVDPPGGGLLRGAVVYIDISVCRFGSAWFWGGNRWNSDWKFEFDSRLVGS